MTDSLLTIRECAEKLGLSEGQLREMARTGRLPANKQAGRWLVQAAALEKVTPLRKGVRRVRGRLAEGTSLDDMTHRLLGRGTVVADPTRPGKRSAAAVAEAVAVEHQLDPTSRGHDTAALPPGMKGKARAAQSKALQHMEQRLDKPHPPERSL